MGSTINFLGTSGSIPFVGMTSTFDVLCDATGTFVSPYPTIQELSSSGHFVFSGSSYQEQIGVGFLLRHQSGSDTRFSAGTIGSSSIYFSLYDASSTPFTAATPVITSFMGFDGSSWSAITPIQTISNIGNGLYRIPVTAEMITKTCKFIVWSSSSAVYPEYQVGSITLDTSTSMASGYTVAFNMGFN